MSHSATKSSGKVVLPSCRSANGTATTITTTTVPRDDGDEDEYLVSLAKRASDLEYRLVTVTKESSANRTTNNNTNNNTNTTNNNATNHHHIHQYRTQLCEVLSDWLLTDPATAEANDVAGRLWRHCFYARIGLDRARVAKEKKRQQQQQQAIATTSTTATVTAAATRSLAKMQESLKVFLGEGILLYEYVCQLLQVALLKLTAQASGTAEESTGNSAIMSNEDAQASKIVSVEGIVPCLTRLYNCWGDLYRYMDHFSKADWAYSMAARLGPGSGHAYNQLAVVSQVKNGNSNQSAAAAITVYWYARSLGATKEPFPTALSNLKRLWISNAEWLAEQREKQSSTTVVLASNASRLFLSQLVNLQYSLLNDMSSNSSENDAVFGNDLRETSLAFRELLNGSAMSDSLLTKLVVVVAFTEFYSHRQSLDHGLGTAHETAPTNDNQTTRWVAARLLTLELGLRMAERVQQTLENKIKPGMTVIPSLRVLVPLTLLLEYLLHTSVHDTVANAYQDHHTLSSKGFWTCVTNIYNLLLPLQSDIGLVDATIMPKEYHEFRGFTPFESFLKDGNVTESGYLTPDVAARERFFYPNATVGKNTGTSQESMRLSSQASGTGGAVVTDDSVHAMKVLRLLGLRPKLLALETPGICIRNHTVMQGGLELVDVEEEALSDHDMSDIYHGDDPIAMDIIKSPDRKAAVSVTSANTAMDDILVYKSNDTGGPALLMPGALLADLADQTAVAKMSFTSDPVPSTVPPEQDKLNEFLTAVPQAQLDLQSLVVNPYTNTATGTNAQVGFVVLPPPGFSSRSQEAVDPMTMLLRNVPTVPSHVASSFYMTLGLSDVTSGPSHGPTIGESLDLFGGPSALQTANPFATEQLPTFGMGSFAYHPSDASFLTNQDTAGFDGTSLLDSSLLSSLLMDDSPQKSSTRNPFAT